MTSTDVSPEVLAPFVVAASYTLGPAAAGSDVNAHAHQVVSLSVLMYLAAQEAAKRAASEVPLRTYEVTGVLSIASTANSQRTQIGIDTGTGKYGADKMWTDREDETAALATRARLQGLVGKVVTATKQTFYEFKEDGSHVLKDDDTPMTRTRLLPGSLRVVEEACVHPDVVPPAARPGEVFVDATRALNGMNARFGAALAAECWGELPRHGDIARQLAEDAFHQARRRVEAQQRTAA